MSLIVFAIIVIIIACLVIWAVRTIPNMPEPLGVVLQVAIILVAALVITQRAGLL